MRYGLDTNMLVYAANEQAPEFKVAHAGLEQWTEEGISCGIPWGVIYEFFSVSTQPKVFPKPFNHQEALRFIQALLAQSNFYALGPTSRHAELLERTLQEIHQPKGRFFHDIETAVVLREHGISEIITADTDFMKFPFLTVTNPFHTPPEPRVSEVPRRRYRRRSPVA